MNGAWLALGAAAVLAAPALAGRGSRAEGPAPLPFRTRAGPWIVEWRASSPTLRGDTTYVIALGHDSHRYASGEPVFKTHHTRMPIERTEEELRALTRSLVAAIGTGVHRDVLDSGYGAVPAGWVRLRRWIDKQVIPRIWRPKPVPR